MKITGLLAGAVALAVWAAPAFPASYRVIDLGSLSAGASAATDLNDAGDVVGWSVNALNQQAPFLWTSDRGMVQVPAVPPIIRQANINDAGQVTVTGTYPGGDHFSFLYDRGTNTAQIVTATTSLGASSNARVGAINDSGTMAGWTFPGGVGQIGVVWETPSVNDVVFPIPFNSFAAEATDINDAGQVVGFSSAAAGQRALIWDRDAGTRFIFGPHGPSGTRARAYAISDNGLVTGEGGFATGTSGAFLWDSATDTLQVLDTLPGGFTSSVGLDVNTAGQVIGYGFVDGVNTLFLWDAENGMRDLNDLIDPASGWTLFTATAINNKGQIVGRGRNADNEIRAYLLDGIPAAAAIPLPAAVWLLLSGMLMLLTLGRRRSQ